MKRKKLNLKGFTMVEMLAAVVILGILSSIGIVSVVNLRAEQREKFDQSQKEIFRQSAQTYFTDNKSKLPSRKMSTERIYLEDLIKLNYIDTLLDYDKKTYDTANSYVEVRRLTASVYSYTPNLFREGESEPVPNIDSNKGRVTFLKYTKSGGNETLSCETDKYKEKCSGDPKKDENVKKYYFNDSAMVKIEAEDKDNIVLYRYYIKRNGKEIYVSDYIEVQPSNTIDDTLVLNKNNHVDGKYTITYVVYDSKGNSSSNKSNEIVLDYTNPTCTVTGGDAAWINKESNLSRIIHAKCTDSVSGCKPNSTLKKEYTTDMNITNAGASGVGKGGTVYDKAGNKTDCSANQTVKIDKTPPVITDLNVSSQNGNYNTNNVNISLKITELNSPRYDISIGKSSKVYNQMTPILSDNTTYTSTYAGVYDGSTKEIVVTAMDEAGNIGTKTSSYTTYKSCSSTMAWGEPTYGACSAVCGSGTMLQTQNYIDSNLWYGENSWVPCGSTNTQVSCGPLPDCCSSVIYEDGDDCTVECGGGTLNREAYSQFTGERCPNQDLASGGSACHTAACCSSGSWGAWGSCKAKKNSKGVITSCKKTRTKKSNGTVCQTQTKSCDIGKCIGPNKCNIRGNTKFSVDVNWPHTPSSVQMTCGKAHSKGYWHYCTDSNGKLYNRLGNSGSANKFTWVCPDVPSGKGPNGSSGLVDYYIIDDSGCKWTKYCDSKYASSSCK